MLNDTKLGTAQELGTDGAQHIVDGALAQIIDQATAGTTYICEAPVGSLSSAAKWRVQRIVIASGVTTTTWADGNRDFDNIADNRASLSYS